MTKRFTPQWYRIDKQTGDVLPVSSMAVARAAAGSFDNMVDVVKAGRFQTPFAIYSTGELLQDNEKESR